MAPNWRSLPAGDAAPVGATEVGGIAGARDGEVGALVLRLVGAVVAVGVAVAPPVLRDAPPALGALESKVARLQNLIPSFPWIAPGWRAGGAIISPNAKIQFQDVICTCPHSELHLIPNLPHLNNRPKAKFM